MVPVPLESPTLGPIRVFLLFACIIVVSEDPFTGPPISFLQIVGMIHPFPKIHANGRHEMAIILEVHGMLWLYYGIIRGTGVPSPVRHSIYYVVMLDELCWTWHRKRKYKSQPAMTRGVQRNQRRSTLEMSGIAQEAPWQVRIFRYIRTYSHLSSHYQALA